MSTTIDRRVVEMQFDNKQFENNVQTSMSTLEKLKRSLNLTGASKGLENIDAAAKKIDFSGVGNAVESVRVKFSALEVMAVTALSNITNSAVNAGKNMIKALTLDPIISGFQEYETQINSVQTILANTQSKGSTLEDVNSALDELNKYADMTIYNFTEMTRNIGTFTAAGVDLDKSVTSIKGIANLAAVSGSNATQASTAMYQLSQALAAGRVSLMDWNSVVNAGMGGEVFQTALKRTATQMGYNVDALIKKYGSFRESLTEGQWLTADVLTETLTQLSGAYSEADLIAQGYSEKQAKEITELAQTAVDAATKVKTFTQLWDTLKEAAQSGWTQTWEIIIGDFEEAKDFLTELSDTFGGIIGQSADARNALLYDALSSNWKKLTDEINGAGISVEEYKDKVMETAKAQGIDIDSIIADYGSLESAFKNGALSSDLLDKSLIKMTGTSEDIAKKMSKLGLGLKNNEKTLKALTDMGYDYSDAQKLLSKDTQSQVIALNDLSDAQLLSLGYTAEQIDSIRQLSNYSELAGGSVKEFIDNISKNSGRENIIDALRVSLRSLISIFETVGKAWRNVFPPMQAERLYEITESIRDFALSLRPSEETLNKLQRVFQGLFSILDIGKQIIFSVASAIIRLLGNFSGLGDGVLGVAASFGDWIYNLDQTIKQTDIFNKVLQNLVGFIEIVIDVIKRFAQAIGEKLSKFKFSGLELFYNLLERIQERMTQVNGTAADMGSGVSAAISVMGEALANSRLLEAFKALWNGVKTVLGGIINLLGTLSESVVNGLGSANFDGVFDLINTAALGGIGIAISKFLKNLREPIEGISGILDNVTGILDEVRGCFEAYQTNLKAGTLLKIASAIGILASAILVISTIDSDKLSKSLGAVTMLFADLMGSMALLGGISGTLTGVFKSCTAMISISVAVLILASALKKVSDLDTGELARGLIGIAGLSVIVVAVAKSLGSGSKTIIKGSAQMVIFAAAIKVLASACKDLSDLNWNELAKGLVGVGVLFAEISVFLNTAKFSGQSITTATGIVILAAAIKVLASACEDFSKMKWDEIGKGLASIGGLLAEIAIFTNLTGNAKNVMSTGVALIAISAAMKIFASAVQDFAGMQWDELARGLTGLAGALLAVAAAARIMPQNMIGIGTGLVVVSASLIIIAEALGRLGSMSWDGIAKGLVSIGGSLAILAVGLNAMNGTVSGSAAMLVAATSLAILTPVLLTLSTMSWEGIAKGLVAIAGAFTVIGVAGLALTPLVPVILALSASLALIGVSILGIGAGLLAAGAGLAALAVGFTALATSLATGAAAIVASLTVIITGIAALIPTIIRKLGEGLIELLQVIADGAPVLGEAVKAVVLTLVNVLVECVPAIADGALQLIAGVLAALVTYTPQIVDSIFQFLISLLQGIADNLPDLIQAAVNVIVAFFSGVIDALMSIDTMSLVKTIAGIGLIAGIMVALSAAAALAPSAMVGVLALGAVIAELALVLAAIGALAQIPGLDWLINEGATLLSSIGTAIGGFIGGILGGIVSGVTSQFPQIGSDLAGFMTNAQPFIQGAKGIDSSVMEGVSALAKTVLILTAADVLNGLTSWLTGGSSLTKFAEELIPFGMAMKTFSTVIAGMDGEAVSDAAIAGKTLAEMAATLPNSGGVFGFFTGENDMTEFANQLVPFGTAMKAFSVAVKGMDSDAVINAATAGKAMAEMASSLPNTGGVVSFFTGDNDMEAFADQLVPFGEAMKQYSLAVAGLDVEAVNNSAIAGKALVELANTIPNTGGLVAFFTGDNNMEDFGDQLVPFGRAMKLYSLAVSGIELDAIENSVVAGETLVELANTIPNTGGLFDFFAGGNDMDDFGDQLAAFGKSLKSYSDSVTGVNVSSIQHSVEAVRQLVEVADAIPSYGLFSGNTSLDSFGSQLSTFGSQIKKYYDNVSSVNAYKLSSVIEEVKKLVDIAKLVQSIDSGKLGSFGQALTDLGKAGINGFISAFTNASGRITQTANQMMDTFMSGARAKQAATVTTYVNIMNEVVRQMAAKKTMFTTTAQTLMTSFISGIRSKETSAKSTIVNLLSAMISSIRSRYNDFRVAGQTLVTNFISGIDSQKSKVTSSFDGVIDSMVRSVKSYGYSEMYDLATYTVEGFIDGVEDSLPDLKRTMRKLPMAVKNTTEDALEINSPSRVFKRYGEYVVLGFANGIESKESAAAKSTDSMARSVIESTKNAISKVVDYLNGDIDTQPTIRPVLDLSDVESKAGKLNAMFSANQAMRIGTSIQRSTDPSYNQNGERIDPKAASFSFVQNNYSPKALSRVEIYRQTKNQFSAMERKVRA